MEDIIRRASIITRLFSLTHIECGYLAPRLFGGTGLLFARRGIVLRCRLACRPLAALAVCNVAILHTPGDDYRNPKTKRVNK